MVLLMVSVGVGVSLSFSSTTDQDANLRVSTAAAPTILNGASVEYTGKSQQIVTNLPAGMRYAISTEYIDPTTVDAGKIVPKGYVALDYLSGEEIPMDADVTVDSIDTGFNVTTGMVCRFDAAIFDDAGDCSIFQASNNFCFFTVDDGWGLRAGSKSYCYYGGKKYGRYTVEFSTISQNLYLEIDHQRLFCSNEVVNYNGFNSRVYLLDIGNAGCIHPHVYFATMWDSNHKLVRDFVPVRRESDGVPGMYDVHENKFYTKRGTNANAKLTAGRVVNASSALKNLVWADSVNDSANQMVLKANTQYYVYYYTPNGDGEQVVTPMAVQSFTVLGHDYHFTFDQYTGIATYICNPCGDRYRSTCLAGDGHDMVRVIVGDDATGYTLHFCQRCNYSKYQANDCHGAYEHKIVIGLTSEAYNTQLVICLYNDSNEMMDIRDVMDTICPDTPQFDEGGVLIYNPNNAPIGCSGEVTLNTNSTQKFNVLYAIGKRVASQKQFSILVYFNWFGTGGNTSHYFIMRDDHIDNNVTCTDTVTRV
ncbi:MAG: hypothetical protein NC133_03660 [Prevotella sp.]|nr:hypothetical protein [Prevotella sp.]